MRMTITELIERLNEIREKEGGDLPVYYCNDGYHEDVEYFTICEATGNDDLLNNDKPKRLVIE